MIVASKVLSSKLEKLNDKTYSTSLKDGNYLNIRQVWGDSENYESGQWKWDLTDGKVFLEDGMYGWDTPESAEDDFYFRHPEYK